MENREEQNCEMTCIYPRISTFVRYIAVCVNILHIFCIVNFLILREIKLIIRGSTMNCRMVFCLFMFVVVIRKRCYKSVCKFFFSSVFTSDMLLDKKSFLNYPMSVHQDRSNNLNVITVNSRAWQQ